MSARFRIDGEPSISLVELLAANADDKVICDWAHTAKHGDVLPAFIRGDIFLAHIRCVEGEVTGLREAFERLVGNRDSYGLRRSHRGTYTNPAIARDWKWFQAGAAHARATDTPTPHS